jgi:hypothetical protein
MRAGPHQMDVPHGAIPENDEGLCSAARIARRLYGTAAQGYIMDEALGFCTQYK